MTSQSNSRSITLVLMDGSIDGRYEYRLDTWNIVAYKIPHEFLKAADDIKGLHTPGVYLLFGKMASTGEPFVYVGEAEDVCKRLNQKHTFEKGDTAEHWEDAIIFVALSDGDLDKAKIKYLEGRFYELATATSKFVVKNGNKPKKSKLAQQSIHAMEHLIRNAELVLPSTGYDVFSVKAKTGVVTEKQQNLQFETRRLPPLPSASMGPCEYAKTALKTLLDSGYTFTDEQMERFGSIGGSKEFTHRNNPIFWILKANQNRLDLNKNIRDRYWAEEFQSGRYRFLAFSQWYRDNIAGAHKSDFDKWYNTLGE